jgi:hypothetical protein
VKTWSCVQQPRSEAEAFPILRTHQDDVRSLDEQGSKIFAPTFGDAAENRSTTCAVLAGYETKPRTEVASTLECLASTYGSDHGGRDQWANARNAHKAPAIGFFLADLLDLTCDRLDPFIEPYPVFVGPTIRPFIRGEISSWRKAGISQATYFNWKKKYDGLLPT